MGRILIAGEPGTSIVRELMPVDGEVVIDKPGRCFTHTPKRLPDAAQHKKFDLRRCDHRGLRSDNYA